MLRGSRDGAVGAIREAGLKVRLQLGGAATLPSLWLQPNILVDVVYKDIKTLTG